MSKQSLLVEIMVKAKDLLRPYEDIFDEKAVHDHDCRHCFDDSDCTRDEGTRSIVILGSFLALCDNRQ